MVIHPAIVLSFAFLLLASAVSNVLFARAFKRLRRQFTRLTREVADLAEPVLVPKPLCQCPPERRGATPTTLAPGEVWGCGAVNHPYLTGPMITIEMP